MAQPIENQIIVLQFRDDGPLAHDVARARDVEQGDEGWPALRERALAWPPERVAQVCGISADEVRQSRMISDPLRLFMCSAISDGAAGPDGAAGAAQPANALSGEDASLLALIDRLDPETRKEAMRAIREAEWFGENAPAVKMSPHRISSRWL